MKKTKLFIFIFLFISIIILNRVLNLSSYFSLNGEWLKTIRNLANDNFFIASIIYTGISILSYSVLALPGVTFAIAAGVIFKPFTGTILCLISATAAACISFIVGRFFLKDYLKPIVIKNKYLKKWLFDSSNKNYIFVLMITRLLPIFPYNLQNFAYGITDIPFSKYFLYSFLFMLPGTAMYTIGTAGIIAPVNNLLYVLIAAIIALFVIIVSKILNEKYIIKDLDNYPEKSKPCVSCKKCTTNCKFLKKYNLDFTNDKKLTELAYHCFLCGKCTELCPHGVDGRQFILDLRKMQVNNSGGKKSGYLFLKAEKTNYIFKNYKTGNKNSVLFPGCNYPSFYPKTLRMLTNLFEKQNIGVVFDCCGKPIAELGLYKKEVEIYDRLTKNLLKHGVDEIITVCPNCYYHLKGKIPINVITIYEKLTELDIGNKITSDEIDIFLPCPDRKNKVWIDKMKDYLPKKINYIQNVQCCGLGGCAIVKEPVIAKSFSDDVKKYLQEKQSDNLYLYCATCAGNFNKHGINNIHHILNEVLGSNEIPDTNRSLINRAKSKFY